MVFKQPPVGPTLDNAPHALLGTVLRETVQCALGNLDTVRICHRHKLNAYFIQRRLSVGLTVQHLLNLTHDQRRRNVFTRVNRCEHQHLFIRIRVSDYNAVDVSAVHRGSDGVDRNPLVSRL